MKKNKNKYDNMTCVGARVALAPTGFVTAPCSGRHDECCEGWKCKTEHEVSVKLGSRKNSFLASTDAPFANSPAKGNQCCLPQPLLDVTALICPPCALTPAGSCTKEVVLNAPSHQVQQNRTCSTTPRACAARGKSCLLSNKTLTSSISRATPTRNSTARTPRV